MNQQDNWPAWISAIGAGVVIIVTFLKSFFVTRGELRESIQDAAKLTDKRHDENLERFGKQDEDLQEIRQVLGRIEGQISGRYPRLER